MFSLFKKPTDMWLFAGLGNPGREYERNRHNAGFMALDAIAQKQGFPPFRAKFRGQFAEGMIGGSKLALLKPRTMMNNSGQSIAAAAKFYKIAPDRIVIFHDEVDLAPGKVKVKQGGGAAGHNGIRSAQDHLKTPDFWRVRIGIGHPGGKDKVHGHVLGDFSKADQVWLEKLLAAIAENCPLLTGGRESDFMTRVAESSCE